MTQGTQLVVVPNDLQLPAHLRTAEAAAAIAATNAAAAGGIRSGGFPRLSKDGGKFHIIDGDSDIVLMNPPAGPGQPALPMGLIRVAIIAGNPALVRLYYKDKKVEGVNVAPTCSSSDGVRPDSVVSAPQAAYCKQCPMDVWGSKISDYSGKKIKACDEGKQLAFFPVDPNGQVDTSKPYGLKLTVSELTEWGQYVGALDSKGVAVNAVITNLMFDSSVSHPKILTTFGGFLAPDQWQAVTAREHDADVKVIVAPTGRSAAANAPALPPPPVQPQLPPPSAVVIPIVPVPPQPQPVAAVPGFGAVPAQPAAVAAAPAVVVPLAPPPVVPVPAAAAPEAPKRTRRSRAEIDADSAAKGGVAADPRIAHLDATMQSTIVSTGGPDGPVGQALLQQFPAPAAQPAAAPVDQTSAPVAPVTTPAAAAPAPAASNAFGGAPLNPAPPPPTAPTPAANDLAARLAARLAAGAPAAAAA